MEYLDTLQLSDKFIEWSVKWLQVMHDKQGELREAKYNAAERAYKDVVKKIERCVSITLSGMITMEEGAAMKLELEAEKQNLSGELSKLDKHVNEWSNLAINTFEFVQNIKQKFRDGTIEQKKTILRVIGSDLILKDKKLDIEIRTPFTYISKVVNELKDRKVEEPNDLLVISSQSAFLRPQNDIMGG